MIVRQQLVVLCVWGGGSCVAPGVGGCILFVLVIPQVVVTVMVVCGRREGGVMAR